MKSTPDKREASLEALEEIFGEVVDLSGIAFLPEAVLGDDIPVDSKDMLRILSRIESQYRFRFRPKEILRLRTVADLLQILDQTATHRGSPRQEGTFQDEKGRSL